MKIIRKIANFFSNLYYWVRTHTVHRYHIVDCRSPQNGYAWGWCDSDRLMWYACFNILKDFVEKELPHSYTDYDYNEEYRNVKQEIDTLYAWWVGGRADDHKKLNDLSETFNWDLPLVMTQARQECFDRLEELESKDNEMLDRLIKIRGHLWS